MRERTKGWMKTIVAVAFCAALGADAGHRAAASGPPPPLTEVQRLQVQNAVQRVELTQLRRQAAQADFDRAVADAQRLFKSLDVDGYVLDLQTMAYSKKDSQQKK